MTFTFSDSRDNTYSMSEPKEIVSFRNIERASIPVAATPGPVSSGFTGDELESSGGFESAPEPDDVSDNSPGSDSEMAAVEGGNPMSSGLKMGCSLVPNQTTDKFISSEFLLVLLGTMGLLIGLLRRRFHTQ